MIRAGARPGQNPPADLPVRRVRLGHVDAAAAQQRRAIVFQAFRTQEFLARVIAAVRLG